MLIVRGMEIHENSSQQLHGQKSVYLPQITPMQTTQRDIISEREAWPLFKYSAIAEAFSWLLLLLGILIQYLVPKDDIWVAIGGSIHGLVFLAYFAAVVGLWRVLRFSLWTVIVAILVSVVPFGTLIFEMVIGDRRDQERLRTFQHVIVRAIIPHEDMVLAIQPQDISFWCLPGGILKPAERIEDALVRTVKNQTGVVPMHNTLRHVHQYDHRGVERVEFMFEVGNPKAFIEADIAHALRMNPDLENMKFIKTSGPLELKPDFIGTKVREVVTFEQS
jgi:integral membrane protein